MLSLVFALLVVGLTLGVVLVVGTMFLQGYYYTEPGAGVLWKAPIAAAVLTLYFFAWCWLNVADPRSREGYVPYDTLFRFSPDLRMTQEPVEKFWTLRKGGEKQLYQRRKEPRGFGQPDIVYYLVGQTGVTNQRWHASGVEAIIIEKDDKEYRFVPRPGQDGDYPYFVSDTGWMMSQYEGGVTGIPRMFSFWLITVNLFLNFFHLALWFVLLWLLLQFQWFHALSLAVVLWLVTTMFVLQPLLTEAGILAVQTFV